MKHHASWALKHTFVMNIRFVFMLFYAALVFQNCKKSQEPDFFITGKDLIPLYFLPDSFLCTASKEVPGLGSINWTANTFGQIVSGKFLLTCLTYQDSIDFEQREILGVGNIPLEVRNNILGNGTNFPFSSYATAVADGDLINAEWELDLEQDNYFEVIQLDTISHIVKGKFDLNFKMTRQGSFGFVHSERINFKNGSFIAKY